jgi:hypothetical protein
MATQVTSNQNIIHAIDYLNQFKVLERTVQTNTNLEDSVVSLLKQCHALQDKMASIKLEELIESDKHKFDNMEKIFDNVFERVQGKLNGILVEVAHDTYTIARSATQWDADHPLPRDFLDRIASVKVRIADLEKIQYDKNVNQLLSLTRNLIYTNQELDHIADPLSQSSSSSSNSASLSFSYPIRSISSYSSKRSCALGYAAVELADIETILYTHNPDLVPVAKALVKMDTKIRLSIGDGSMLMPIGGLVLYHLQMIQLNESHEGVDTNDPHYILKAFMNTDDCTSTPQQKQRAIRRAKLDVLMHAYRAATRFGETPRADKYFRAIKNAYEEGFEASPDDVPELACFKHYHLLEYKSVEKRLRYMDDIRTKMYAAWKLP